MIANTTKKIELNLCLVHGLMCLGGGGVSKFVE